MRLWSLLWPRRCADTVVDVLAEAAGHPLTPGAVGAARFPEERHVEMLSGLLKLTLRHGSSGTGP